MLSDEQAKPRPGARKAAQAAEGVVGGLIALAPLFLCHSRKRNGIVLLDRSIEPLACYICIVHPVRTFCLPCPLAYQLPHEP